MICVVRSKDGAAVQPSDRIQLEASPDGKVALKISEIKPEDAGKYELSATNEAGTIKCSAPVTVARESATILLIH